jgi:hypothetical protein
MAFVRDQETISLEGGDIPRAVWGGNDQPVSTKVVAFAVAEPPDGRSAEPLYEVSVPLLQQRAGWDQYQNASATFHFGGRRLKTYSRLASPGYRLYNATTSALLPSVQCLVLPSAHRGRSD